MNGYSEAAEERWANSRLNAHLDALAEAEYRAEQEDAYARAFFGEDYAQREVETADPERFVSEADYFAPTEREREDLQITDDVLAFWTEYHKLPW
jgi:hypothetical protein